MGRKKTAPPRAHDSSPALREQKKINQAAATPLTSLSTTASTKPTCSHCDAIFPDMTTKEFQSHVDHCSRPSTAGAASTDSPLSTLPGTPSQVLNSPAIEPSDDVKPIVHSGEPIVKLDPIPEEIPADAASPQPPAIYAIRPYINPDTKFDYYNQPDASEEPYADNDDRDRSEVPETVDVKAVSDGLQASDTVDTTINNPKIQQASQSSSSTPKPDISKELKPGKKAGLKFPKFTPIEVFQEELRNPEDMPYDELYARTARVSDALAAYQAEWDSIEKEINRYESLQKAELKRVEEAAKQAAEEEKSRDDEARAKVQEQFSRELKLKGQEWLKFLAVYEQENTGSSTLTHLQNLKNPQFMAIANKKKRGFKSKEDLYENAPITDVKITKEESNFEKRKRGRLMDPIKFDDMKYADAYGFDYSSHAKHYGNQPIEERAIKKRLAMQADDAESSAAPLDDEMGRTRVQRRMAKKVYDTDRSGSPESDDDGLPTKRARRTKVFEDGVDANGRSRTHSRSGTPGVTKTFPSGRRIGRPPKSKLQAMQVASETPDPSGQFAEGDEYGTISQELNPLQEEQLHFAAEALINQTVANEFEPEAPPKKKHAGGRPRKVALPADGNVEIVALKPKNKGGRPRKNPAPIDLHLQSNIKIEPAPPSSQLGEDNGVLQSTEQRRGSPEQELTNSGRPKTKRTMVETDNSTLPIDSNLRQYEDPFVRKARAESDFDDFMAGSSVAGLNRKRWAAPAESTARITGANGESAPKKRRTKAVPPLYLQVAEELPVDPNAPPKTEQQLKDEQLLRVKQEKSRKLSESMKRRWAAGEMETAKQTRAANNALKKAAKEREKAEASGVPVSSAKPSPSVISAPEELPVFTQYAPLVPTAPPASNPFKEPSQGPPPSLPTFAPKPAAASRASAVPKPLAPKRPTPRKPKALPPKRKKSRRERKPTIRKRMGGDAAEEDNDATDSDDTEEHQATLYDQYQGLTSPGGNTMLGKRVRKSLVASFHDSGDEDEDEDQDDSDGDSVYE